MVSARKAIESRYKGLCTVIERQAVKDKKTKITSLQEVIVFENLPCRLSYGNSRAAANQTGTTDNINQEIRLFLAPEHIIKPGSKITVIQNNVSREYTASGVPAVYENHQEIALELFERWA